MSHWRESLHHRDHDGKFTDMPGGGLDITVTTRDHTGGLTTHDRHGHDPTLPADPYQALTDVTNPFTKVDAIDAVHHGRGTEAQRQAITDALALRKQQSRNVTTDLEGMSPDAFRSKVLFGHSAWSSGDDQKAIDQATKVQGLLNKYGGTPEHHAALAERLDEVLAENAYNRRTVGMPGGPQFSSNQQGREWAAQHMPAHLTPAQAKAVHDYTGGMKGPSSTHINKALRFDQKDPEWADQVDTAIKEIDAAIAAHTLPEPLLLHRGEDEGGIRSLGINPDDPDSLASLTGRVIHDDAFWSTSIGRRPGGAGTAGGHVTWLIRTPAGQHGLAVNEHSAWQSEGEILLPRGTKRVIHAAYRDPADGYRIYIEAEVVPADWTYPPGWQPNPNGDAWKEYQR
jgi:hypothetical protein